MLKEHQEDQGIHFFDRKKNGELSVYDAKHLDLLAQIEEKHFWFKHRAIYLCGLFEKFIEKKARILELGGGTGWIASQLQERGFHVELADLHLNGLRYARKRGIQKLYQVDLFDSPFEEEFDVVCLFDVLEHLKDPVAALACIKRMVRPGGQIILSVPAHEWLWSRDDRIAGHFKRYTKQSLRNELAAVDVKLLYMEYFFTALLPFLWMRRWLKRDDGGCVKLGEEISFELPSWLNQCFDYWMALDKVIPKWAGGSLVALVKV